MTAGSIIIYFLILLSLYSGIFFFLVLFDKKSEIYRSKITKNYPKVCIIVPCFNEELTIVKTAHSLMELDYPKDKLEILIIDDGSLDNTLERARSLEEDSRVRVFHKKNGGKYTALNYGLEKTEAEFIGCLDADSFVAPDALRLVMAYFENPKNMAVISSVKIYNPRSILQKIQRIEFILGVFLRKIFDLLSAVTVTPGPFSIFRKKVFTELGPYRKGHNTEDLEIALRMQASQYTIVNAPDACVYTISPSSFLKLLKQRKRWYHGLIRNLWDYRKLILNKKYGDLAYFVIPATILSVFFSIAVNLYAILWISQKAFQKISILRVTGFSFREVSLDINWFFINTNAFMLLSILLLGIGIMIIFLGKKMSVEKNGIWSGIILFLIFYSALYFIWWTAAIMEVIFNKKNRW